jgi:hypothetical protein
MTEDKHQQILIKNRYIQEERKKYIESEILFLLFVFTQNIYTKKVRYLNIAQI